MPVRLTKIDSYLARALKLGPEAVGLAPPGSYLQPWQAMFPVLVRVRDPQEGLQGLQVQARLGNIISGRATADAIYSFDFNPNVLAVEASRQAGIAECASSVPFVGGISVHNHSTNPETGDAAIVAVIDTGIDILHEAFLDDQGNCRVLEIWDQRDPVAGHGPDTIYPNLALNYGRVHTEADIRSYLSVGLPPSLSAPASPGKPDTRRHGTHVASIAAGRAAGSFAGGMAPGAKIIFVIPRLKTGPSDPLSIGYSSSHHEALAYIGEAAADRDMPVVVNVSLGMNAGAHDGTSLLETGFDEFTEGGRKSGVVVVKSAGNERGHRGHASLSLGSRAKDALMWYSSDVPRDEDHIELWFQACNEYKFWLTNPNGDTQPIPVTWNKPDYADTFPGPGNGYSMTYTRYHHDNGDSQLRLNITADPLPVIEPGMWTLHVETGQVRTHGEVHAWIERDRRRAAFFTSYVDEDMTLSIPGTARTTITVGAVNSSFPVVITRHSSYGTTRDLREKPDLVAPGDTIEAAEAGTLTGTIPLTGTSMAAPHVAGAIAFLLSRKAKQGKHTIPNAAQIKAALVQHTRTFTGHHTKSSGFGVLDAAALFDAFE